MKLFPRSNQAFELQVGMIILWFIALFVLQFLVISPFLSVAFDANVEEISSLQEEAGQWSEQAKLSPSQLQSFVVEKAKKMKQLISPANYYYIYCSQIAYNIICFLLLGLILRWSLFGITWVRPSFQRRNTILYFSIPFLLMTLLPLLGESLSFNEWFGIDWLIRKLGVNLNESSVGNMIFTYAVFVPENSTQLITALFFVGLIPAFGEEIFFRGTIQKLLLQRFGNPHNAIFVTALIFSLMHFEITAFFYRFFLGVVLGYLYYWGRSLLFPIVLHALNNCLTVISMYWTTNELNSTDQPIENVEIGGFGLLLSAASAGLILFNFYWYHKNTQQTSS